MKRTILKHLRAWQRSEYRKPLYLRGVSRSGKTWVLREFGKQCYRNTVYISFREHEEYRQFFENAEVHDAGRILQSLMLTAGQRIVPEKTLLILDDVQECPDVFDALEVFYEQAPQFHIVCAGAPLDRVLPVGKINLIDLGPMTFSEVLLANGNEELLEYLENMSTLDAVPEFWFQMLLEKLKVYFVTGGMPEAVYNWIEKKDVETLQSTLSQLAGMYEHSFSVYTDQKTYTKVLNIWKSIPLQLSRENKKFFYKLVKEGARAREYEEALKWLSDTLYVKKIYRNTAPVIPFPEYDDVSSFRVYLSDVGLLRRIAMVPPSAYAEGNRLFTVLEGALSENYVLTALTEQFDMMPRYWSQNNPFHEIDFVIQREGKSIPIEVKPELHGESRSMKRYRGKWGDTSGLCIRFSLDNLKYSNELLNIPLFLADYAENLISLALNNEI